MKRLIPALILFPMLAPSLIWAEPFAGVTDARDAADGVAVNAPAGDTGSFAGVTDPRDTMPMAPPVAVPAAPIDDRTADTPLIPTPHVDPSASITPKLPALVKRPIQQDIAQAAPGVLLVQPANTLTHSTATPATPEIPMNTNGTLNGQMFNDRTETLTPNGVIDDQPDPKDGFSFGGGSGQGSPPTPPLAPTEPQAAIAPTSPTAPLAVIEPSTTQPSLTMPIAGPVRIISSVDEPAPPTIISPATVVSPIVVTTPTAPIPPLKPVSPTAARTVSVTVPLAQPIAAALTFMADDVTLSARTKQQLQTFGTLAKGNVLHSLTLSQRTVAPLNALNELADARRKIILDTLKTNGIINDQTKISEVRTRSTAATSKITLIGN